MLGAIHNPRYMARFAGLLLTIAVIGSAAYAEDARPEDTAAVNACLKLVKTNQGARVPGAPDEQDEKPGAAGSLAAAAEAAPRNAESCIGVVANACQQKGDTSTAGMIECQAREAAVWDVRLNAAYKKALAGAEPDVAEGYRKVQRAWIAYRDASCAQPRVVYKGTMAGPMSAYCVMEMTARQSLWLERWDAEQ